MTIKRYNEKRNFKETPEPAGKTAKSAAKALLFVIQKHEASHLHYDFRLELEGVMKSWAVPKGPSLNPDEKRLAMHVEDHPMAYRTFEGIIPQGNYGAGTVMVWDEGTYYADEKLDKKANEKILLEGYRKGKLTFHMQGKKLHGEFALVRMRGKSTEDNAWLLLKHDDADVDRNNDIRDQDKSAASGRSMKQIADNTEAKVWISNKQTTAKALASKTAAATKKPAAKTTRKKQAARLAEAAVKLGGKKTALPKISGPQLATLVDEPFDREGWAFEIKWDGYRALGYQPPHEGKGLISRNGHSFDDKFAVIRDAVATLPCTAVVDGEIVVLNDEGKASFERLQNAEDNNANLFYYLFDLLYVDGVDIRAVPLSGRKQLLQQLLEGCDERLRYSDHVETRGLDFFEAAKKGNLEGIIAKDMAASYQTGSRTRHWLKIKLEQRQEFIIAGYTRPRRSRSDIGSLVLAYYGTSGKTAGKLKFAGHVGSGMDTKMRANLKQKLDRLALKKSPFLETPATNDLATWVKPELVCEVRYTEKTTDCQLRHPVFIALRSDKPANEIHWDMAQDTEDAVAAAEQNKASQKAAPAKLAPARKKAIAGRKPAKILVKIAKHAARAVVAEAANKAVKKSAVPLKKKPALRPSPEKSSTKAKHVIAGAARAKTAAQRKTVEAKRSVAKKTTNLESHPSGKTENTFSKEAPERDKLILKINGKSVVISHPKRIYYPELKLSKMDVIDYYRSMSPYLLPYLKDRPFVLHRFPGGIYHGGFYQKDNEQEMPSWVKSTEIHSESTNEDIKYLVCQNEATLVYLANLGCIEMNPWNSRLRHIDKPDWMIFDLDPVDISFTKVVEVAQVIHGMFEASGIPHYCKTSGKRGLHIAVPLGAKYSNDTVREMAEAIARLVHQELPGSTSLERSPAKRQKKIYLDYLQNGMGKTLTAPYSLRPVDYAGVSTPLHWDEVNAKLDPRDFNIHTIIDRVKSEGDLWQGVLTGTINLKALLQS